MAACLKRDSNVGPPSGARGGKDSMLWRDSRTPSNLPPSSLQWAEDRRTRGVQPEASRWREDKRNATAEERFGGTTLSAPGMADAGTGDVERVNGDRDRHETQPTSGPGHGSEEKPTDSSGPAASENEINCLQKHEAGGAEGMRKVGHPAPSPDAREPGGTRKQDVESEPPKECNPKKPTIGSSVEEEPSISPKPTAVERQPNAIQESDGTRFSPSQGATANTTSGVDASPSKSDLMAKATPPRPSPPSPPSPPPPPRPVTPPPALGCTGSPPESAGDPSASESEKAPSRAPNGQGNSRPTDTAANSIYVAAPPKHRSSELQSSGPEEATITDDPATSTSGSRTAIPLHRPTPSPSDTSQHPKDIDELATVSQAKSQAMQASNDESQDARVPRAPIDTGTDPKDSGCAPSTKSRAAPVPSLPSISLPSPLGASLQAEKGPVTAGRTQAVPKPKQSQRKHATGAGVGNRTKKGGSGGGRKGDGGDAIAGTDADADADASKRKRERAMASSGKGRKRRKAEAIRPLAAPVPEPGLEIPEVSEADVGKMVLSETGRGTLTGVIEKFVERNGLGVWSIRYENGQLEELDDCGELHDDMCAYYEFAGNVAASEGKLVRTPGNHSIMEQIRTRLFEEETKVLGRRVCKVVGKTLQEGQVTKYIHPKRDGEIDLWRVTWDNGEKEDLESFELIRPLLRYVERRIEQREIQWGFRKLSAYLSRIGNNARPFATLAGISASMYSGP